MAQPNWSVFMPDLMTSMQQQKPVEKPFSLLSPLEEQQMAEEIAQEQQMSNPQIPVPQAKPQMPPKAPIRPKAESLPMGQPNYEADFQNAFKGSLNDRKAMLDKLKAKYAAEEGNQPTGLAALNLKPFMSLADSLTGQKTAQNYENTASLEHQAKLQKLQDAVTQQSDKLSDDQLGYLKAKAQEQMFAQRGQYYSGLSDYRNAKLNQSDDRLALQAGKNIENDPIVRNLAERKQQLGRDLHTLDNTAVITPQIFDEIQKGITNAITGARSATMSDTEAMKVNTLDQEWARLKQKLASKPEDIHNPELKKYMRDLIIRLDDAYKQNMNERTKQLSSGVGQLSSKKAKAIVADKVKTLNSGMVPSDNLDDLSEEEIDELIKNGGQ